MKCKQIVLFFEHIVERQENVEPAQVFGFKIVKLTRQGPRKVKAVSHQSEDDNETEDTNTKILISVPIDIALSVST